MFGIVSCLPITTIAQEQYCTASALKKNCKLPVTTPRDEARERAIKLKPIQLERKLKLPGQELLTEQHCQAEFEVSFMQMNDRIRVDTLIDHDQCGASGGEYTLRVRTYKQGESITRTMTEQWQRSAAEALELTTYYPMEGANTVGWVRVKTDPLVACLCAEEGASAEPEDVAQVE